MAGATLGDRTVRLHQALFWMNIHLELLAADQRALRRMRALVIAQPRSALDCEADLELIATEVGRLMKRLSYWAELVDRLS